MLFRARLEMFDNAADVSSPQNRAVHTSGREGGHFGAEGSLPTAAEPVPALSALCSQILQRQMRVGLRWPRAILQVGCCRRRYLALLRLFDASPTSRNSKPGVDCGGWGTHTQLPITIYTGGITPGSTSQDCHHYAMPLPVKQTGRQQNCHLALPNSIRILHYSDLFSTKTVKMSACLKLRGSPPHTKCSPSLKTALLQGDTTCGRLPAIGAAGDVCQLKEPIRMPQPPKLHKGACCKTPRRALACLRRGSNTCTGSAARLMIGHTCPTLGLVANPAAVFCMALGHATQRPHARDLASISALVPDIENGQWPCSGRAA